MSLINVSFSKGAFADTTWTELECGHRKTSRCLRLFCSHDEGRRRRWRQGGPEQVLERQLEHFESSFFFCRWGISDGPSLDYSKETVSEDEETFILSLDCFTSDDSEEDESLLL